MEKGKLCKDEEGSKSSDNSSDNNIFDDDFMRGDFGFANNDGDSKKENGDKSPEKTAEGDEEDQDDQDH